MNIHTVSVMYYILKPNCMEVASLVVPFTTAFKQQVIHKYMLLLQITSDYYHSYAEIVMKFISMSTSCTFCNLI